MKKLGVALVEKDKSSEIKQDVAGTNFKHAEVEHKEAGFFVFYFDNPSDKYIEGALHFSGKGVQIDKPLVDGQDTNIYIPPETKTSIVVPYTYLLDVEFQHGASFQAWDTKPDLPSVAGNTPDDIFKKGEKKPLDNA